MRKQLSGLAVRLKTRGLETASSWTIFTLLGCLLFVFWNFILKFNFWGFYTLFNEFRTLGHLLVSTGLFLQSCTFCMVLEYQRSEPTGSLNLAQGKDLTCVRSCRFGSTRGYQP